MLEEVRTTWCDIVHRVLLYIELPTNRITYKLLYQLNQEGDEVGVVQQAWHPHLENNIRKYPQMKEVLTAILLLNQVKVKLQSPILGLIMNHQTKISKLNEKAEAKKRLDQVVGVELEEVQDLRGKKGLFRI